MNLISLIGSVPTAAGYTMKPPGSVSADAIGNRSGGFGETRHNQTMSEMVYIIQDNDSKKIKIGRSKHPTKRLQSLSVGSPGELELVYTIDSEEHGYQSARHLENAFHDCCSLYRCNGEWFEPAVADYLLGFFHGSRIRVNGLQESEHLRKLNGKADE